jgi:hypothetical protein
LKTQVNRAGTFVFLAILFCVNVGFGGASASRDAFRLGEWPRLAVPSFALHEAPVNVSASDQDSRYPALAVSHGTIHIAWEENERVYHAFSGADAWSSGRSVAVGEQPTIAADASDRAHAVLVNLFGGNYEIYHCRWNGSSWTLPRNVSNTSGVSSAPSLAIAPDDGTPHVVWADNTPGYNVIYHAYWNGTYWINEPIPHAMGGAPAVAVNSDGVVHVVWQDRDWPGAPYEIYYSRWDGSDWSLPEDLSDSPAEPSIIPSVAVDQDGQAHVGWQEKVAGRYVIYYTWGRVGFWSIPEKISNGAEEAYLPSTAVSQGSTVYVGWDESTLALYRSRGPGDVSWSQPIPVTSDPLGAVDLRLAVDVNNHLHAAWGSRTASSKWDVFYQNLSYRLTLPVILKISRL